MKNCRIVWCVCGGTLLVTAVLAQQQQSAAPIPAPPPVTTFQAASRLVAVEVVARDHQGHPITGLTADDFQLSEQVEGKREQHPQKIAAFRAVNVADIAAQDKGKLTLPAGVYTNIVTMNKVPCRPRCCWWMVSTPTASRRCKCTGK
jgi:hypothetical protein